MTDLPPELLPQRKPAGAATSAAAGAAAGAATGGGMILPRRTAHVRRTGRHRSPHRLSVASGAPDLVLAVPGRATEAAIEIAYRIAEAAEYSCPGVEIRIGFIADDEYSLASVLAQPQPEPQPEPEPGDHQPQPGPGEAGHRPGLGQDPGAGMNHRGIPEPAHAFDQDNEFDPASVTGGLDAVVVPLLVGPHPDIVPALAAVIAATPQPVMLAPPLGPHPLLAEALHDRLAESGLARAGRARGLNITAGASGILLLAARGPEAASAAGVTAVLLAARLAVPVVPASIDDPAGIAEAVNRLRDSGAAQVAISPSIIGPECDPAVLNDLARALGAPCAAPLGAHSAIAQLVAIRYGEALARISVASH